MQKTKTTKKTTKRASTETSLTWSAEEYSSSHRWWWYVGLVLVGGWLSLLMIAVHQWTTLALIIAVVFAFFVFTLAKPGIWKYTLTKTYLEASNGKHTLHWKLEDYRAFSIDQLDQKSKKPFRYVTLLPLHRIGTAKEVYFPTDEEMIEKVLAALIDHVRYEPAGSYQRGMRLIDRLARVLRID